MNVALDVVALSHRGAVRDHNEDSVGVAQWTLTATESSPTRLRVPLDVTVDILVADGLGGHRGGARASREAVTAFLAAGASTDIAAAIAAADERIHEVGEAERGLAGMGTTIAGVRVAPDLGLIVFNVGDSRVYRLVDGFLGQLSEDDRPPGSQDGVVTQVLGGDRRTVLQPHLFPAQLALGETLLLCTDGLHDTLEDDVIEAALRLEPTMALTGLLERALAAGAPDNLSMVLVTLVVTA